MEHSKELTGKSFLKKLIGFSMASWLSAAISFLITPVFTRLYSPADVGHINLFTTYMTFFQTVCVLALDQAFMRFYNESLSGLNKNNFLRYCLKINLGISAASAIIILGGYRFFSMQITQSESIEIPICLVIVILCSTFLRMSSISSRMENNVFQYTLQILLITIVEKVLCTLIAFYKADYKLAIVSITAGYILLSVIFFCLKRKSALLPCKHVPRDTTLTILKFSIPYLPVLLLAWLNTSIPLIVLRNYVDYSAVGIYTNAVTIANILTIIQTGFSAYWSPFIYEHYKEENNKAKIQKIERSVVVVLFCASIGIVLFQDIIYLLVGEKFRASKIFFPLLMLTPICNSIADMTGIGIMLSRKSYLNIFTFITNTSVNLLCSYILIPRIGMMGAGIAVGASALSMLTVRTLLGERYYKISPNNRFIVFSIGIMLLVCVTNIIFSEQALLKYFIVLALLGIFSIIFRRDIGSLIRFVAREIQNWIHKFLFRHKKEES